MRRHSALLALCAMAFCAEAGYDVMPWLSRRASDKKLFVFGRYEYYNSYIPDEGSVRADWTQKHRIAVGLNYLPVPEIAIKAEYSHRFLPAAYNPEPSVSLGVCYMAFFKR